MKVLVIDNYDSFTYNLVHYLEDLDCEVTVKRNDKLSLEDVDAFEKIGFKPGKTNVGELPQYANRTTRQY